MLKPITFLKLPIMPVGWSITRRTKSLPVTLRRGVRLPPCKAMALRHRVTALCRLIPDRPRIINTQDHPDFQATCQCRSRVLVAGPGALVGEVGELERHPEVGPRSALRIASLAAKRDRNVEAGDYPLRRRRIERATIGDRA